MVDEEVENEEDIEEVESEEETFDENEIDEETSDFSISDTILSTAPSVKNKHSSNLENLANEREKEKPQWDNSDEVDEEDEKKGKFYDSSRENLYGENLDKDTYVQNRDETSGLYNEKHEGLYTGGNSKAGLYDAGKKHTKSYGEVADNRRSGRSMLEIAGFEDKEKQKNRDTHGLIKYEGKMD